MLPRKGMYGVFETHFSLELAHVRIQEVAEAARLQCFSPSPALPTNYAWGTISYQERPSRIQFPETGLYGPEFLQQLFGWEWDIPTHDGLVCQVEAPKSIEVDSAQKPLALKWNSESPRAKLKKARPVSSLLKKAYDQVPKGEMGFVYIAYREGSRPEMADERTDCILSQFKNWSHKSLKIVPAIFLQRLYPRTMPGCAPDLIENTVRLLGESSDPIFFDLLPSLTFTPSSRT